MVLMRFWASLPTMLKFAIVVTSPMVLEWSYIGEGAFWCSLNISPHDLEDSPMYSSSHSTQSHLYLYMTPTFLRVGSLSLEVTRRLLMVLPPLKNTCTPFFVAYFLQTLTQPLWYREQPHKVSGCLYCYFQSCWCLFCCYLGLEL